MSASPAVRSLRAAVFAALCVALAAAGHGLATGDAPPPWADGAGFLTVFAAGWLLGGRERSLPGIGAAMLVTQAALHEAFDAARTRAATRHPFAHLAAPAQPRGHAALPAHLHAVLHCPVHGQAAALTPHATTAHVLAALVASWWLRRGEAALWSLLRRAVALLPGLAAWWRDAPAPSPVPTLRPTSPAPVRPRRLLLGHAVSRRGPPAPIPYAI